MDSYNDDDLDIYDPVNRKRRRGIIEKRRRDRINNSLVELRRLIPLGIASEKETSTKLEKAEILQMTVDYLKCMEKPEQDNSLNYIEYKAVGFRECILEMSRYLVNIEGFELNHPLRLRLLSHLQSFVDENFTTLMQTRADFIPSSSSSTSSVSSLSSPQKFESACFQTTPNKQQQQQQQQHYGSTQQSQQQQFLNNPAFVQINITAANTNNNSVENKLWPQQQHHSDAYSAHSSNFAAYNRKNPGLAVATAEESYKYFHSSTQYWNPASQQHHQHDNKSHFSITG